MDRKLLELELFLLYSIVRAAVSSGRDVPYDEKRRLEKLREKIDSYSSNNETKPKVETTKPTDDIPF